MSDITETMSCELRGITVETDGLVYFHHSVTRGTMKALARRGYIEPAGVQRAHEYKTRSWGWEKKDMSEVVYRLGPKGLKFRADLDESV